MSTITKHGVDKFQHTGRLPKGCGNVAKKASRLREVLESSVLGLRNSLGPADELLIQSACRHEVIFGLLLKYLTSEPGITLDQKIAILGRMQSSATARDKPIADLKIEDDGKTLDGIVYDREKEKPRAIA